MATVNETLMQIAAKLVELAGGAEVEVGEVGKPGMTAVHPTGVYGKGKVRYYPKPIVVNRWDGPPGIELWWSYCIRMTSLLDENGQPYIPVYKRGEAGSLMQKMGPDPSHPEQYAEAADKWGYEEDWWDEAEIQKRKDAGAQWRETEANMRG